MSRVTGKLVTVLYMTEVISVVSRHAEKRESWCGTPS